MPLTNTPDSDSSPPTSEKDKLDWIGTGPRCVARFDYEGEGVGDLCFDEGDYIRLLERVDTEWVRGELHGNVGMFPLTFVEVIEDLPSLVGDGMNDMISLDDHVETVKSESTIDSAGLFNQVGFIMVIFSK